MNEKIYMLDLDIIYDQVSIFYGHFLGYNI